MTYRRIWGLVLALGLSACGGAVGSDGENQATAAATPAPKASDPCSLATAEEVGAVLGEPIVATEPGEGSCQYQTADAMASSVTIELNQSDAAGQMATARQAASDLQDVGAAVADQGGAGADTNALISAGGESPRLGDESFFGPNQQLSVRKGSSYIAISPPMMRSRMAGGNPILSADDKKRMALAIAEKAVARLP